RAARLGGRRSDAFFFQAEDGIRDRNVTGVQTCALPIFAAGARSMGKSGTSLPVHFPASSSHQTNFLRSDQGVPSGAAEARLYRMRRLAGHAHAHSAAVSSCSVRGLPRAAMFSPPE